MTTVLQCRLVVSGVHRKPSVDGEFHNQIKFPKRESWKMDFSGDACPLEDTWFVFPAGSRDSKIREDLNAAMWDPKQKGGKRETAVCYSSKRNTTEATCNPRCDFYKAEIQHASDRTGPVRFFSRRLNRQAAELTAWLVFRAFLTWTRGSFAWRFHFAFWTPKIG